MIALVNLDPDRSARVVTNLKDAVRGSVLTAATMDAHNTFELAKAVAPAPYSAAPKDGALTLDLPPKSIVVVTTSP